MDPHAPQYTPPEDDEGLTTPTEPDDTEDDLPATDGEPLEGTVSDEEDIDEIQEPLEDEDVEDVQDSEEVQETLSENDGLEDNTSISDNSDEANAYEDDDKPSPQP